jgi:hypothetical protein
MRSALYVILALMQPPRLLAARSHIAWRRAHAGELANVLREGGHPVPPELTRFGTHVKKKESKLYGAHFKDVDTSKVGTKITFD